jgi:exosortase family protein XrtM
MANVVTLRVHLLIGPTLALTVSRFARETLNHLAVDRLDLRFAAKFGVLFSALFIVLFAVRDTRADQMLLDVLALHPSAWIITFLAGDPVQVSGASLISPHARLNVLAGCDGRDALLLLLAAVGATRAGWIWKLLGAAFGVLLVCALNYLRITALYFVLKMDRQGFDLMHGYLLPAFVIVGLVMYFVWWLRAQPTNVVPRA